MPIRSGLVLFFIFLISGCSFSWEEEYEWQHNFKLDYRRFVDAIVPELPSVRSLEVPLFNTLLDIPSVREESFLNVKYQNPYFGSWDLTIRSENIREEWKALSSNIILTGSYVFLWEKWIFRDVDVDILSHFPSTLLMRLNSLDMSGTFPEYIWKVLETAGFDIGEWYYDDPILSIQRERFPELTTSDPDLDRAIGIGLIRMIEEVMTVGSRWVEEIIKNNPIFLPKNKEWRLTGEMYSYPLSMSSTGAQELIEAWIERYAWDIDLSENAQKMISEIVSGFSGHGVMRVHATDSLIYSFEGNITFFGEEYNFILNSVPEKVFWKISSTKNTITSTLDRLEDGRIRYSCVFEDSEKVLEFFRIKTEQSPTSKLYSIFIGEGESNGLFLMFRSSDSEFSSEADVKLTDMEPFRLRVTGWFEGNQISKIALQHDIRNNRSSLSLSLDGTRNFEASIATKNGPIELSGYARSDDWYIYSNYVGYTSQYRHQYQDTGLFSGSLIFPLGTMSYTGSMNDNFLSKLDLRLAWPLTQWALSIEWSGWILTGSLSTSSRGVPIFSGTIRSKELRGGIDFSLRGILGDTRTPIEYSLFSTSKKSRDKNIEILKPTDSRVFPNISPID